MRVIFNESILIIGSAGLRCGRWATKRYSKKMNPKLSFEVGWHFGKCYAYLWSLSEFGLVNCIDKKTVLENQNFRERHYKGWIELFPGRFANPLFMKKSCFEDILHSNQPHQGKNIIKDIRRMYPEIK